MAFNPTTNVLLEELRKEAHRQAMAKEIPKDALVFILASLACVEIEFKGE